MIRGGQASRLGRRTRSLTVDETINVNETTAGSWKPAAIESTAGTAVTEVAEVAAAEAAEAEPVASEEVAEVAYFFPYQQEVSVRDQCILLRLPVAQLNDSAGFAAA